MTKKSKADEDRIVAKYVSDLVDGMLSKFCENIGLTPNEVLSTPLLRDTFKNLVIMEIERLVEK